MQLIAPPRPSKMRRRRGQPQARGVALIFVLTTIAILTAIGVDFSYNSRVNLELAAQSRDSLRAENLAMSGITFGRLLLHYQAQIDQLTQQMGGIISQMLAILPSPDPRAVDQLAITAGVDPRRAEAAVYASMQQGAGTTGAVGTTGATGTTGTIGTNGAPTVQGGFNLRLYCGPAGKIDSGMAMLLLTSFPTPEDKKQPQAIQPSALTGDAVPIEANFGEFTGTFDMKVTSEDARFNINRLGALDTSGGPMVTANQIYQLISAKKYDFLFQEEDHNHDKVAAKDVVSAMRDWVDIDTAQTAYDPTILSGSPFAPGGGDENGPYSRYKPPYKAKNAGMDSIDEIRQVYGVNDNFMLEFGDKFTVYPNINTKIDVNSDNCGSHDTGQLMSDILSVVQLPLPAILQDPYLTPFVQLVQMQIDLRRKGMTFIGISATDFLAVLQADGLIIRPELLQPGAAQNFLSNTTTTFRVQATGYSGRLKRTITTVVKYDAGMGQVLYWHVD